MTPATVIPNDTFIPQISAQSPHFLPSPTNTSHISTSNSLPELVENNKLEHSQLPVVTPPLPLSPVVVLNTP